MPRSHPPTLLRLAERTLREDCRLERGERVLVAISGGADSCALLHVMSVLGPRLGLAVVAHGVDHGLRPEAAAELDLAARLAERLAVPFDRSRVEVAPGGNLQARAREARHRALSSAADREGASRIATAHHADDRAETVVMRLLNGAPIGGLGVLPPVDGRLVRPLLRARRSDILAHLERHGIPHAEDPSNQNRRFLRVKVRLDVMPVLEALAPSVVAHLTALADDVLSAAASTDPLAVQPGLPHFTHLSHPPHLQDPSGAPVTLRGAHRREVRRALHLGQGARIRISGGREVVVDPRRGEVRVDHPGAPSAARSAPAEPQADRRKIPAPRPQKGGAKPGKRG